MKHLVGKDVEKEVNFMGDGVIIRKLSAGRVLEVQELVAKNSKKGADPMKLVIGVIRLGVKGADDLSDKDFLTFPLDEMNKIVDSILVYSGLKDDEDTPNSVKDEAEEAGN